MVTLTRKIVVPTVLLGTFVAAAVAWGAWGSVRDFQVLEAQSRAVRTANAFALALDDVAQDEDRAILTLAAPPDPAQVLRLARATERVEEVMGEISRLALAPRAASVWAEYTVTRRSLLSIREAVLAQARRGDAEALGLEVSRWRLMSGRGDELLKDFTAYHLRFLDRTVAAAQERRARALGSTIVGALMGLVLAGGLAFILGRAVVRPIIAISQAAERIADTGRLAEVGGATRRDEIGTLARSFNRMTERLVTANAQLAEADRRKDEFLGMLSHELRNPLAPVRNALYVLDRADPSSPQATRAREVLQRQVAHLTRLVDDLLDVTRIARGKIELHRADLDLGELVRRCGEDHAAAFRERGHELRVETPPPGSLRVHGDETRLAQVIGNLLQNAAKFTPPGGRIDLVARRDGERAEVRVRDTGIGIGPELLPHVFEPFTQAKQSLARTEGGLGLGLALVKAVTDLHGGAVEARSPGHGGGAEFVVSVPLASLAAAEPGGIAAAPPAGRPLPAPAGRAETARRVLLIEDSRDAAETLAEILRSLGHEVDVAHDGPSGVAQARARPPDVVLCDVGLPGMDGYEVARRIRDGGGPPVRIVALTGYAQPEDVARAMAAGFDAHVAKPADPDQLASLIG